MGRTGIVRGLILVLSVPSPGCAGSAYSEVGAAEAEVVVEAGEIDSRTVAAGARVVVVHGRGERHPVSGEWARLDTLEGYVQAVDAETLVLAREGDLRQERISLDRIQRMIVGGPPSGGAATGSVETAMAGEGRRWPGRAIGQSKGRVEERSHRTARKLGAGALGGFLAGSFVGVVAGSVAAEEGEGDDEVLELEPLTTLFFGTMGYTAGAAAGVSWRDPHDRFVPVMAGSIAGLVAGAAIGRINLNEYNSLSESLRGLWTLYALPVVFATLASEWSRDPPADLRLSIRLRPHPWGGMSAAAALRF